MVIIPGRHPSEDAFEDYAFDRLRDDELAKFEEHLLICERCQATLAKTDEYIVLMKVATAAYASDKTVIPPQARRRDLHWNFAIAAVIFFTCLTGLLSWRVPILEPKAVALDAYRGSAVSKAPARRPLDLKIDLKDVRSASGYRVEVVDSTGRRVWFGGTPAHLDKGLPKGDYWVRLFTENGEWLREYALVVRDSIQ